MKGGIQDRRNSGLEGYRKGGIQESVQALGSRHIYVYHIKKLVKYSNK